MTVLVSVGSESHGNERMEGVKTGRRRVWVQTESGCVLGMDLYRNDNAHVVKRKLQNALNVSTDEISLTFGDMVLKNDLRAVRNYPLLMTRNVMRRSSSAPCLLSSGRDIQQRDHSRPIEILGDPKRILRTKKLVDEIVMALEAGVDPVKVSGGLGGAYFFKNIRGESVAIVKPTDEEPFAPNNPNDYYKGKALGPPRPERSIRVGETGFREVAAYLLDHDHFANVPPTALVKIAHSIFNVDDAVSGNNNPKKKSFSKIASFQQFIPHDFVVSDHGPSNALESCVHRIGILDIRIFNTDRHGGNLLVRKLNNDGKSGQTVELIPIDHGLCLPESFENPYWEWISWRQSLEPFSEDELEYIKALDPWSDCEMLRSELPMIREACLRVLILSTIFLQEAAGFGLCLAEIGEMMSREFRRGEEVPSDLEVLCIDARRVVAEMESKTEDIVHPTLGNIASVSNISMSLKKNLSLGDTSTGHRSAVEQLPKTEGFVKVADMNEEEWFLFLEKFQDLLHPTFMQRRQRQRQKQRLGTS